MKQEEFMKKFGFNVKVERMKKDYTQAYLAEIMNCNDRYITNIENGRQNVTIKTIYKIAKALGVESHKLFIFD